MNNEQELSALRQANADLMRTLWIVLHRSGGVMTIPRDAMEDVSPQAMIESEIDVRGDMTLKCVEPKRGNGHDQ
jgi:hypothetical protein